MPPGPFIFNIRAGIGTRELLTCTAAAFLLMTARARAQFIITEFIADNNTSLIDEVGENPDWVEIYNEGAAAASPADLT